MSTSPALVALSERDFQAQIIDLAEIRRWRVAHFHDSRRQVAPGVHVGDRHAAGFPDLILARPPRLLALELKREKARKPTGAQREWLRTLGLCGVEAHLLRPSDWPTIERLLA